MDLVGCSETMVTSYHLRGNTSPLGSNHYITVIYFPTSTVHYHTLLTANSEKATDINHTSLLSFDEYRCRQRAWPHTCEGLNSDCIYSMRCKITDCRQLIVVHHLRLPWSHSQWWIHSVVDFVTLRIGRKYSQSMTWNVILWFSLWKALRLPTSGM